VCEALRERVRELVLGPPQMMQPLLGPPRVGLWLLRARPKVMLGRKENCELLAWPQAGGQLTSRRCTESCNGRQCGCPMCL
jgi:hypothetical protein